MVQQPVVSYHLVEVEGKTVQQLQFNCSFTAKDDYYYQVVWYIEGTRGVVKDAVKKDFLSNTYLGYNDEDAGYKKLNINVSYYTALYNLLHVSFRQKINSF